MQFNIGIIGCGLIGSKRFRNIGKLGNIIAVSDKNINNAKSLVLSKKIDIYKNWKDLLKIKTIDSVIIATYHDQLSAILIHSLKNNKNVLVEKAISIMNSRKITSLCINNKNKTIGIIHIHHLLEVNTK